MRRGGNRIQQQKSKHALEPILRGASVLLAGYGLRILVQSLYFVVVTRGLGAEDFGRYSGIQAVLLTLVAFTSLGYPVLAVRDVSRQPSMDRQVWSDGLRVTLLVGGLLAVAVSFFGPPLLGVEFPRLPLLLLALAELPVYGLILVLNAIQQGRGQLRQMAVVEVGLAISRLITVGGTWWFLGLDLGRFALAHASGSILWLFIAVAVFGRGWTWPLLNFDSRGVRARLHDGINVCLYNAGRSFLLGADKMLLPGMAGLVVAGQYAAAFRVAAFALLPIQALMSALYPRFFLEGGKKTSRSLEALWRRTAPLAAVYGAVVAAVVFAAAPLLQPILGMEYPDAPRYLRHLIWLVVIQAVYLPLGDTLAAQDRFGFRTASIALAILVNLSLNLWLIPAMAWKGAVIAAYASHFCLLISFVFGAVYSFRRVSVAENGDGRE